MRRSRRIAWWTAYGLGAAAVVGGLAWTSVRVVQLEREERVARLAAERQETLRLALWRLDSWLAPRLARESARTWIDYEPYHPQTIAYNRLLEPIAEGEVLLPSPLLEFTSPFLTLHFQWRASTGFTSPQVPSDALVALGTVACGPVPSDPDRRRHLAECIAWIDPHELEARLLGVGRELDSAFADNRSWTARASERAAAPPQQELQVKGSVARSKIDQASDYRARQNVGNAAQTAFDPNNEVARKGQSGNELALWQVDANVVQPRALVDTGPMVPIWLGDERLVLARRVQFDTESVLQGAVVDWALLKAELLAQLADIAPNARLVPAGSVASDDPRRVASIPVCLELAPAESNGDERIVEHPAALGLGIVWCAALGAIGATGLALRSSIGSAVRTNRFAASVTHELRTPLTTFQLYTEMLADGIIPDEARRREYLLTLRDESARLGILVENVLAWSRVEDGRAPAEPRLTTVAGLAHDIAQASRRRCDEAGVKFETELHCEADRAITTDPDRVRQIVSNLIDNSCKYAGRNATVRLTLTGRDDAVVIAVEDDGPGVPAKLRARIFRAFDRGGRGPGDPVRGLGLGLAIAHELARSLGGRMGCDTSALGGARLTLELPGVRPRAE